MAVSKKQQAHVAKYVKNHYDTIIIRVPKGEKEKVVKHAGKKNLSLNAYINQLIDTDMQ